MQHRITVLFPTPLGCFDYKADRELSVGSFVMAPFGRKKTMGIVWDKAPDMSFDDTKVKMISDEDDKSLWPSSEGEMEFLCGLGHQLEYRMSS